MNNPEYGDLVQIRPEDPTHGGCVMFVLDVDEYGVKGRLFSPKKEGITYLRRHWNDVEWCGQCVWEYK